MRTPHADFIIDRLRQVSEAKKSFDSKPSWATTLNRSSQRLTLVVAIRLNGMLWGGVSIRLATPADAWEEDLYGHVEVRLPGVSRMLRLDPIEWRPLRHHDNPSSAPEPHRNQRLWDRHLPFALNAPFGLGAFDQSSCGIAVPLPDVPETFSRYTDICASLWKCPDMMGLAPPPWARKIL